jgi:hypothetical protein
MQETGITKEEQRGRMNFDELWRQNLATEQSSLHSNEEQEEVTNRPASEKSNELNLTAEDGAFLSQVGIESEY